MASKDVIQRDYFHKVRAAREALAAKAQQILNLYIKNAKDAMKAGDREVAQKSLEFLILHMPKEDGLSGMVDQDVDKPKAVEGAKSGPQITIGFALPGLPQTKFLAPTQEVIDITPEPETAPVVSVTPEHEPSEL